VTGYFSHAMDTQLVYLDNAATTPVRPEAREAMAPCLTDALFGNPSSAHRVGRAARATLEKARRRVAEALGCEPADVIFTSGGTEADNLAVIGTALGARAQGRPMRVAVSAVEHKAVLEATQGLEQLGGEAIILPVDGNGVLDLAALDDALGAGVAVVSVMWVNNETGVLQDIPTIAERCLRAGVPFHTDAVQAVGKVPCSCRDLPITLMTVSGHKIGAPKGIGALIARDTDVVEPLLHGGGQQLGIRPGTENLAGAVALGVAVELAVRELEDAARITGGLRDDLEQRLRAALPDLRVNSAGARRAPHISSLGAPGTDSQSLQMHLDVAGIACSGGSACSTGSVTPSHVLTAMGVASEIAVASLRFSFSKRNSAQDVDRVVHEFPKAVSKVRELTEKLSR